MGFVQRFTTGAVVAAAFALVAACGGGTTGDGAIRSVTVAATGDTFQTAIDATPSPDGAEVFFTAANGQAHGVFRVPAAGGTVATVALGAPFEMPVGIAAGSDGGPIYVADTAADVVFAVPVAGGAPVAVPGTQGLAPRGLEVVSESGADVLYVAGRDGVFKIPATGAAAPTVVAKGAPLGAPEAVTVARDGTVYATDREGVFRITAAGIERVAAIRAPVLAGVTLTLDDSTLLVSTLSGRGSDQVLLVDTASGKTSTFDKVIGENRAGAGLHRARNANVFAWADATVPMIRPSRVYVLRA
jgi:sugar lactone lactonase YvrE